MAHVRDASNVDPLSPAGRARRQPRSSPAPRPRRQQPGSGFSFSQKQNHDRVGDQFGGARDPRFTMVDGTLCRYPPDIGNARWAWRPALAVADSRIENGFPVVLLFPIPSLSTSPVERPTEYCVAPTRRVRVRTSCPDKRSSKRLHTIFTLTCTLSALTAQRSKCIQNAPERMGQWRVGNPHGHAAVLQGTGACRNPTLYILRSTSKKLSTHRRNGTSAYLLSA